jgi:nucleotide-binding universal stress UspA family protein
VQKVKKVAEEWFSTIRDKSSANGIRLKTGLVVSSIEVEDAIVNYADRENFDLTVIGDERKSGLERRLHGPIASQKAAQTKRPLLIVK